MPTTTCAPVTVETVDEIRDADGAPVYDATDDMHLLRVCMQGALDADDVAAWWTAIRPAVERALADYGANPPDAAPPTDQSPETLEVVIPIPDPVLAEGRGDGLAAMLLDHVEEAALIGAYHRRGEHMPECRAYKVCQGTGEAMA